MLVLTAALTAGSAADAQAPAAPVIPLEVGRYSTVEAAQSVPVDTTSYLYTMKALEVGRYASGQTDASNIAGGQELCRNEVAHGLTWASLDAALRQHGISSYADFYRVFIPAAVATFCPEYLPIR